MSIKLKNSKPQSFQLECGEILYEGLLKRGLELPHGCLAGSCSACKVVIFKGAENLEPPGSIESNTLKSVYGDNPHAKGRSLRLSCRAKVLGPIEAAPFS